MNPCFCGRSPRGFAWHDFAADAFHRKPAEHCCSMACLDIVCRSKGMAPGRDEARAVTQASEAVGAYLEQLGKTDLAQMTRAEWEGFLLHAFTTVAQEVRTIAYEDCPF